MTDLNQDPNAKQALAEVEVVENRLQTYVPAKILTPDQYATVGLELQRIKGVRKLIEDTRKRMTRPLDEAKQAIMDFFRGPAARLDDAEDKAKRAMLDYDREQQRIADEQRRQAEEQARRDREFQQQRAARLAEQGRREEAQQANEQAALVQAPVVQAATPQVSGIAMREVWRFEVTDPALLPREFLIVDERKLRAHVELHKGATSIPGVRVFSEKQIASRRR